MPFGLFTKQRSVASAPSFDYESKALGTMFAWMESLPHPRILDLGPARGDNIEFFGRYHCRLEVLDLFARLSDSGLGGGGDDGVRLERSILEAVSPTAAAGAGADDVSAIVGVPEPFDAIFAWDLLDFLSPQRIAGLGRALAACRHDHTRLFAQVSYLGNLPLHPRRYRILDRGHLRMDDGEASRRPSPRYSEPDLLKRLSGLKVEHSFLMRHGFREYVFRSAQGA